LASIYHDIVYIPGKSDNEARSADTLRTAHAAGHVSASLSDFAAAIALIESSGGEGLETSDGRLFWDVDRSILATERQAYLAHAAAVRREFSMYPDLIYQMGRKKFLKSELARDTIFRTVHYRGDAERRARDNIAAEIESL